MDSPTVLVDCDGVICDFVDKALDLVFQLTGQRFFQKDITTWEFFDCLPGDVSTLKDEVYGIMKQPGQCLELRPFPGAVEGLARLRERAHVRIVTHPFRGAPHWMWERTMWLQHHFGIEPEDIIFTSDKRRVHGQFFIDDHPEHVERWMDYWHLHEGTFTSVPLRDRALLWATPRNLPASERIQRVRSWDEVLQYMKLAEGKK